MARVLVLTELLSYPLVSGAKIRGYYVLRHLSARHEVTLLSFVRPDDRPEDIAHLETFVNEVHTVPMKRSWLRNIRAALASLLSGQPAIIAREEIGAMRHKVKEMVSTTRFDVIHADQIPMAQYGLIGQRPRVRRILDQHNATFQVIERLAQHEPNPLKRWLLQREARAFARYEPAVCQQFDHVTFVTEEDREALLSRMRPPTGDQHGQSLRDQTSVIPICVDTAAVEPVPPVAEPFRVTHVGTMYWPPNVEGLLWFLQNVWPQVRQEAPQARLTLIGKNPPDHLRAWDQRDGVEVLGYVEDLERYLAETAAFVVPLLAAGGMRVKIVDAWCWGQAIVSTTIGAEGIAVQHGENILIANTPAQFAQATARLLSNGGLQARLRANGREWVEERYDWHKVYRAWDPIYDRLGRS